MQLRSGLTIRILEVNTEQHLTNFKPYFLREIAAVDHEATVLVYCDPDMVLKKTWRAIEEWCSFGIAAVADANWNMPASSPVRQRLLQMAEEAGFPVDHDDASWFNLYCNAGFVGVPREHLRFLQFWQDIQEAFVAAGFRPSPTAFRSQEALRWLDQDCFNIALMAHAAHLSLLGPESMDFAPGGTLLSHAAGRPKPWQGRMIRSALGGHPPSKTHAEFLRYALGELEAHKPWTVQRRRVQYKIARSIGACYRKQDY
jgi:hypothetical protein